MSSRVNLTATSAAAPSDTKRIFCAYHPNQLLTNFCCDKGCLMPLCPNCIVEHTEQHFLQNNKPTYTNLSEALHETKQKCYQHIVMFEELSRSNDRIFDYVLGLRESIHNQMQEDKQEIFRQIDRLFQKHEEKLFNQAVEKYKAMGVYDRKESANISDFVNEQIETLHEQIAVLKGDNCLAGLITYFASDGEIYEESMKDLGEYVEKHKKAGRISINMDSERLMKTLEGFCEGNLVVEFISQGEHKEESGVRESQQQSGRLFPSRLGRKLPAQTGKQNKNSSNQDYKHLIKKSQQYYKIDASDLKSSKTQLKSSLTRPQHTIRHY